MGQHAAASHPASPESSKLKRLSGLHLGLGVLVFVAFPLLFVLSLYVLPAGPWGGPLWLLALVALFALAVALMASSRALDVRGYRTYSLVCGVLALLLFPIGTAVGIYTLWVLTRPEIATAYRQGRLHWDA
jgi:NhaP-type Na+/H+ or K+/H+ antiporter